jgi:hypothetical protein
VFSLDIPNLGRFPTRADLLDQFNASGMTGTCSLSFDLSVFLALNLCVWCRLTTQVALTYNMPQGIVVIFRRTCRAATWITSWCASVTSSKRNKVLLYIRILGLQLKATIQKPGLNSTETQTWLDQNECLFNRLENNVGRFALTNLRGYPCKPEEPDILCDLGRVVLVVKDVVLLSTKSIIHVVSNNLASRNTESSVCIRIWANTAPHPAANTL